MARGACWRAPRFDRRYRTAPALLAVVLLVVACAGGQAASAPAAVATGPAPVGAPAVADPATTPTVVPLGRANAAFTIISAGLTFVWLAEEQGLWKRHGLDVDLSLISGMPPAMAALLAGEIQFVHSAGESTIVIQAREPDIVGILNWNQRPAQRFLVRAEIQKPEDMRGKRIGVFTRGDGNEVQWTKALTRWGLNPETDVTWQMVGGGNQSGFIAAMMAGAIDAAMFLPPNDLPALQNGAHVLANYGDFGFPHPGLPTYTLRRTIDTRRPAVEAYLKGIVDAIRLFKSNPELAKETIARRTGISDPAAVDAAYEAYRGDRTADRPYIDLESMRAVIEDVARVTPEVGEVRVERSFDNSILQGLEAQGYFDSR